MTVIPLTWYQNSVDRDCFCYDCHYRETRYLPVTMRPELLWCRGCLQRGFIVYLERD